MASFFAAIIKMFFKLIFVITTIDSNSDELEDQNFSISFGIIMREEKNGETRLIFEKKVFVALFLDDFHYTFESRRVDPSQVKSIFKSRQFTHNHFISHQ